MEPISGVAATGFLAGYRPPAQWVNYLTHFSLAWVDYLRGPGWGAWTRAAHGGDAATFTSISGLAVDHDDTRAAEQRYRYAIVGAAAGPAAKIAVSKNGFTWKDRAVPTGADSLTGIAQVGAYWLTWGLVGATDTAWSTPVHDGSSASAIGASDTSDWSAVAALGGYPIRGVVSGGADIYALPRAAAGQYTLVGSSDDGTTWPSVIGYTWTSSTGRATSIAYDDSRSRHVVASSEGETRYAPPLSTAPAGGGVLGTMSGIPTDARVILVVGGPTDERTLLAWASFREDGTTALAATLLWRSTDGGTTWSAITPPTGWGATITDIAHVDGTWIATQSVAPYLWRSDDDGQNWERLPLPVGEESSWALYRAVYADGQILATGLTWTATSTRASAASPGTWTSREPTYLADAGYLRGRRIHTTAPTNGQVYAWVSANSRWEPVSASGFTVTTTRGDIIRRGATADERYALGTRGYLLRAGATDPTWSVAASSETSLPTAGADYAGAIICRTDLGAHYQCTEGGIADEWAWRVLSVHDGAVAGGTTPDDAWTTIASTQIAENSVALLDIEVAGIRSDHAAGLAAKGYASFLNDGGTLTETEALSLVVGDPLRVQLTTAGPDVEVQVKGVAAEDWTWRVKITRRLEVGP